MKICKRNNARGPFKYNIKEAGKDKKIGFLFPLRMWREFVYPLEKW
jgi:hypothetical protein